MKPFIKQLKDIGIKDVPEAGGKNASLGEMIKYLSPKGVKIPGGFVVTASAYRYFLKQTGLDKFIKKTLQGLNTENLADLARRGKSIRDAVKSAELPDKLKKEIVKNYRLMEKKYGVNVDVAVRSSATAEDVPEASFAGQHETFLNIRGEEDLLKAVRACFASLFMNRAISYRVDKGFSHFKVALSVGVQKMVRSDLPARRSPALPAAKPACRTGRLGGGGGCSGVIFTLDTESGFPDIVLINGSWGLGEMIVQGEVIPDEFLVFKKTKAIIDKKLGVKSRKMIYSTGYGIKKTKIVNTSKKEKGSFVLNDGEIIKLVKWSVLVEEHYSKKYKKWMPMDLEWAKDGKTGELFIIQARPETVHSLRDFSKIQEYVLDKYAELRGLKRGTTRKEIKPKAIVKGTSVGSKIAVGKARVILDVKNIRQFKPGEILVTDMTSPDWEPIMKIASAIITDKGGRTSHAAIVSRELGIPCFKGETVILTDKGFLTIQETYERIIGGEKFNTLSFNLSTLRTEWKEILNASRRKSATYAVSVSQSGRNKQNFINTTSDHQFLTINNREIIYHGINDLIENQNMVCATRNIPFLTTNKELSSDRAYLNGAFFSDGYWRIQPDGTSSVVFIQRLTDSKKLRFITAVKEKFKKIFNYSLKTVGKDYYYCYKKDITQKFIDSYNESVHDLVSADKESVINYLAGFYDGDGGFIKRGQLLKASFDIRDKNLIESLVVSCLRLGLNYRVFAEPKNNKYGFYIYSGVEKILEKTKKIVVETQKRRTGSVFFAAKQVFGDIKIGGRNGIKSLVKKNCLISIEKIKKDVLPFIKKDAQKQISKLLNSDIHMLRAKKLQENGVSDVFNLEVKDNNNYIVFTKHYTPLIVKNCIVGTENATRKIKTGQTITVDTTGSEGLVFDGTLKFKIVEQDVKKFPKPKTKIMMNIATPEAAFEKSFLPNDGVGLAREEFIIASDIGIHPMALINYRKLPAKIKKIIDKKTVGYKNKTQFYIDKLAYGIAKIAAAFYPKQVIVRFSDFKTNEYRSLIGGELYEPLEENPMIGWRGASRYYHPNFSPAFILELKAIKKVREEMGLDNVVVMVPFCRTVEEGKKVIGMIKKFLKPLKIYVMCEIPSNVILADEFLKIFDGMSVGSNDLTQLTVGIDRDASELVRGIANENDESVKKLISEVIKKCRAKKKYVGICGQGPSDYPEFAEFLVEQGIESISLNPDTIIKTTLAVYKKEKKSE